MKTLSAIIRRDITLFFKDKGMLFTSLITPLILLVLYASFLGNVYRDSFVSGFEEMGVVLSGEISRVIDGCVGGQLVSSLLAVSCITVAFCSNLLMVQDKVSGARSDLTISPVRPSLLALGYYVSTAVATWIICMLALAAGLGYIAAIGWYLSVADVLWLVADVTLLVLFGTAMSSIVSYFLSSQGQISAVGTIVSSCYGFICGAYMPISSFAEGLRTVLSYLPFTYATALLRNHAMRGAFAELEAQFEHLGLPDAQTEALLGGVDILRETVDSTVYFHGKVVPVGAMIALIGGVSALLMLIYLAMNLRNKKRVR